VSAEFAAPNAAALLWSELSPKILIVSTTKLLKSEFEVSSFTKLRRIEMDKKSNGKKSNGNGSAHSANGGSAKSAAGNGANLVGENAWRVKVGLAEMLKGGVIMDVTNAAQAKIAEKAGACAVMALERVPSDIRKEGGVARMANIKVIREIMNTVTIPVMAKVRIGHFAEAEVLQALEVDFIDESEVLTPADEENHVWKHDYRVPFVCGARNLGEALRRIAEGAAMIRTKGEAGSGNVVEAVRHMRTIVSEMKRLTTLRDDEIMRFAKELGAPLDLVRAVAKSGKLPVPNFSAGGIATPADAALVRSLGAEAVFVGSGIFKSSDPEARAKAVVKATTHFNDPKAVLEASEELGEAMPGLDVRQMEEKDLLSTRGW
jgi:pyridoxal 5'-phosphate synthase pdxS subunit